MTKIKSFPAPSAHAHFGGEHEPVFTTEKPTGSEEAILDPDVFDFNAYQFGKNPHATTAEKLVGFLVRGALQQARYVRTLHNADKNKLTPDSTEHIQRLIRSVATSASVRFRELYHAGDDPACFRAEIEAGLSDVEWENMPWAPVPTVTLSQTEDGGKQYSIEFIDQGIIDRNARAS